LATLSGIGLIGGFRQFLRIPLKNQLMTAAKVTELIAIGNVQSLINQRYKPS